MIKVILLAIALVSLAILGLAIRMVLVKNGKFPETHISRSPHMKAKKIFCVKTFDKMEQSRYVSPNKFKGIKLAK
jgi:hypothetical protein